jgi:hypothetical protein
MHSILAAAVYVAIVLTPCAIARFATTGQSNATK